MSSSQLVLSTDFLDAFERLPHGLKRKVKTMVRRFESDSRSKGLNYEKIQNADDPNMRSIRIDDDYRAIVLKPDTGQVHLLLWADKHDPAYRWATRHRCSVNVETGALQVYQPREVQSGVLAEPEMVQPGMFAELRSRQLVRLGVPEDMTGEVHEIQSEAELESMRPRLPPEAYEALFYFMAGDSYEQIVASRETPAENVDATDFSRALEQSDSRSRFVVIENDLELEEVLNAPLERWRVFLHPSQRRLVERHWNGPVRVLGGAGTGKTVVAMHRARWLAEQLSAGGRILFTTFTTNLASDIKNNLRSICSLEQMKRIEVTHLDRWVSRFLSSHGLRSEILFERDSSAWNRAWQKRSTELNFPESFYEEEWELVVQARGLTSRDEYLRVSRAGRGVRLNRSQRAGIWPVFAEYRAQLAEAGKMEIADCYRAAQVLLEQQEAGSGFGAVIVDEAQDFKAPAWRLIRSLVAAGQNDLFITGDAHQRIFSPYRVVLGQCGIDIRGRGRKLRLNYRTTEQTHGWASRILAGCSVDNLDGSKDDEFKTYSITRGPEPRHMHFANSSDQDDWLVSYLSGLRDSKQGLRDVCVVARTRNERDRIKQQLEEADVEVVVLERDSPDNSAQGVRLATMHRVKGLEFNCMLIAGVNSDTVPLKFALQNKGSDSTEKISAETAERCLLYVAATRARKELIVLSFGQASPFLD